MCCIVAIHYDWTMTGTLEEEEGVSTDPELIPHHHYAFHCFSNDSPMASRKSMVYR